MTCPTFRMQITHASNEPYMCYHKADHNLHMRLKSCRNTLTRLQLWMLGVVTIYIHILSDHTHAQPHTHT